MKGDYMINQANQNKKLVNLFESLKRFVNKN